MARVKAITAHSGERMSRREASEARAYHGNKINESIQALGAQIADLREQRGCIEGAWRADDYAELRRLNAITQEGYDVLVAAHAILSE
jgi:hypothetical protein